MPLKRSPMEGTELARMKQAAQAQDEETAHNETKESRADYVKVAIEAGTIGGSEQVSRRVR